MRINLHFSIKTNKKVINKISECKQLSLALY